MLLIDYWTVVIIISNLCHFFGLMFLISPLELLSDEKKDLLIGLGTFLIYLSLLKYFQYSQEFYMIPGTMINSSKAIISAFVTFIPVFMGIGFFCMTNFGLYWRFKSLDYSCMLIWSVIQADELQNLYHFMIPFSFLLTNVFLYIWVFFSNEFIQSYFLAHNEDGYVEQKQHLRYNWLQNSLADPGHLQVITSEEQEDLMAQPNHLIEKFTRKTRENEMVQLEILDTSLKNGKRSVNVQELMELEA